MTTINQGEAEKRGMRSLTKPYDNTGYEKQMLRSVVSDMQRGGIRHAVVETPSGVEVWRSNMIRIIGGAISQD